MLPERREVGILRGLLLARLWRRVAECDPEYAIDLQEGISAQRVLLILEVSSAADPANFPKARLRQENRRLVSQDAPDLYARRDHARRAIRRSAQPDKLSGR